jgi:hypothetical protein
MASTTITFENMSEAYRVDVEKKIVELTPVAADIHAHLISICKGRPGHMISTEFRVKSNVRIVEKDLKDYDGHVYPECLRTQVKDMFAARLCPPSSHLYGTDAEEETKQLKATIRNRLFDHFKKNTSYKFSYTPKTLKIGGREFDVDYITFMDHIELQILSLEEAHLLEATHGDYENKRAVEGVISPTSAHASSSPGNVKSTGSISADTLHGSVNVEEFDRVRLENTALYNKLKASLEVLVSVVEPLPVDLCRQLIDCSTKDMDMIKEHLKDIFPVFHGSFSLRHEIVIDFFTDCEKCRKVNVKQEITQFFLKETLSHQGYDFDASAVKMMFETLMKYNIRTVQMIRKCDDVIINKMFSNPFYAKALMEVINSPNIDVPVCEFLSDYYCDIQRGHCNLSRRLISRFMRRDGPLSLTSPIEIECPQGINGDYLYRHLINHLVLGGLSDEAKFLLLNVKWSIGVLGNRTNGVADLQKQYELASQSRSDIANLDDSLLMCYNSIMLASSFISSHQDENKIMNSFFLNQIGRLRSCELLLRENSPLQAYLKECFVWWKANHKYIPYMYRLPSPRGKCQIVYLKQNISVSGDFILFMSD